MDDHSYKARYFIKLLCNFPHQFANHHEIGRKRSTKIFLNKKKIHVFDIKIQNNKMIQLKLKIIVLNKNFLSS